MATIPLPLASKTLQDLKMLGSHDAGMGYFANAISFREGAMVTQMTHLVTQANCRRARVRFSYRYLQACHWIK